MTNSERMKLKWQDPEYRKKRVEDTSKLWDKPGFRENQSKKRKGNKYATGHKVSDETKKIMSDIKIQKYKNGYIRPMLGFHQSQDSKSQMSKSHMEQKVWNKGLKFPEDSCPKMSDSVLNRTLRDGFNKSKRNIRKDLKEYGNIMSSLEANMIRYLKLKNEPFDYQIPILLSNNRWYVCDFYLPNKHKLFLETKGWKGQMDEKCNKKYELLQKDYSRINWRILFQNSGEWKNIVKKYAHQISNWGF